MVFVPLRRTIYPVQRPDGTAPTLPGACTPTRRSGGRPHAVARQFGVNKARVIAAVWFEDAGLGVTERLGSQMHPGGFLTMPEGSC